MRARHSRRLSDPHEGAGPAGRRGPLRLLAVAVTVLATVIAGVTLWATSSGAAVVAPGITGVTFASNTVSQGNAAEADFTWSVPDNSQPGDTFSLTVGSNLAIANTNDFTLYAPDGVTPVATAHWSGNTVTFTLTSYVTTHPLNVNGTGFIQVLTDNTLPAGSVVTGSFNNGTQTFTDTITLTPGSPGDAIRTATSKGSFWTRGDQGVTNPTDAITWQFKLPTGSVTGYHLVDTIGSGQTMDCASFNPMTTSSTTVDMNGNATGFTTLPANRYTLSCTATGFTLDIPTINANEDINIRYFTSLSDNSALSYSNSAVATWNGHTDRPSSTLNRQSAGGGGSGTNVPNVSIVKFDTADGDDATTGNYDSAPGKTVPVGTPIPITMTITNTGTDALINVVVTDATSSGPAITGLSCDFSALGGPASGTTWAGPLAVNASFNCTGTVPAMPAGTQHTDNATVAGTGQVSGTGVTASNPWNGSTPPPAPAITIKKFDTLGGDDATTGDYDSAPGKSVPVNTAVPITMTITNAGNEALTTIAVTDATTSGPAITGLSCDFSALGGPGSGTTWAGPFAVGASFDCTGTVPAMPGNTQHSDNATVTGIGQVSLTSVSASNPWNGNTPPVPSVTITKYDTLGGDDATTGDYDTAPGKTVPIGTPVPISMTITNDGQEPLTTVAVTDATTSGPAITGLSCDFSPLGGPATGTTWAGPLAVDASFNCTGTVPAMAAGTQHSDNATVSGIGQISLTGVTASNPWNGTTPPPAPGVSITKYDTLNGDDATTGDYDSAPGKTLPVGTPVPISMTITNTGNEALTTVAVTDATTSGPAITDLSCDFSALGGPGSGTTWAGPFAVGASFPCTGTVPAMAAGVQHSDNATVTGIGQVSLTHVTDSNPWNGATPPAVSVGDYVWVDSNGNGIQDDGGTAAGIPGVVLTITGPDGGPVTDVNGNPVGTQTTTAAGYYQFANLPVLPAGESYTTHIDQAASATALAGYVPTTPVVGDDRSVDSSTGSSTSLADLSTNGASDETLDYGFVKPVQVGDYVWVDTNHNGIQDEPGTGIPGVVLTITDVNGNPVTDVNGNPVGTQTTDSTGYYHFTDLPPGQYITHIDQAASATVLAPYVPTLPNVGDRAHDSSTDSSTSLILPSGSEDETLDYGFYPGSVSVGDYVWIDSNHNGIQDAGEQGIPGVTLVLTGPTGQPVTDINGNTVGPTVTDANGLYGFANLPILPAGQHYTVAIDSAASATALAGYTPTLANVGTNLAVDSSTGSATSTDLTTDGAKDLTLDFGFYKSVSVGDYVWLDANHNGIQDSGEQGIPNVTLTLTGPTGEPVTDIYGNPVGPTTTDSSGHYEFANLPALPPGQHYTVTVTPPAGYTATLTGQGTRATDSSTGSAESTDLINNGDSDQTLDFGFYLPAPLTVSSPPATTIDTGRAGNGSGPSPIGIVGGALLVLLGLTVLPVVYRRRRSAGATSTPVAE